MLLAASIAAPTLAHAETWEVGVAWGNDLFTELDPPIDDSGFTNDLHLRVRRTDSATTVGLSLSHRMITERGGERRWDQLDLLASASRTGASRTGDSFIATARVGPALGGDLGGRWLQNAWHGLTSSGPTLAQGLQHRYDGPHRAALIVGAQLRALLGPPTLAAYATVDGQLALGSTGVTSLDIAAGARARHRTSRATLGAGAELALARYASSDANLTIPGGHRTGAWHLEWRISASVAWSRYSLTYEYRAGEGGSGEPIGVVDLGVGW